jgi:heme exporter protein C
MIRGVGDAASVLALVGIVNLPIIKFSVDWWSTLHQSESVFRSGGPTIDSSMLMPLMIMALGYLLLFVTLLVVRMRSELNERKARALRFAVAPVASAPPNASPVLR